jgi:acetyl-CoA carboxylase biotin carboxyl carrier protein
MNRFPFNPDAIRMLADILVEKGLVEIELADKDSRIRVVQAPPNAERQAAPVSRPSRGSASAPQGLPAAESDQAAAQPGTVVCPMVGIVYLSPEPEAPPFVTVGQSVAAGQTLLLVEAMKSFSPIVAPVSGTVTRILVANGEIAEFGQALMLVE